MTKKEVIRFLILRTIGNFFVLFAMFGVASTFGPALYYEVQFRIIQMRGVQYRVATPAQVAQKTGLGEVLERQEGSTSEIAAVEEVPSGLASVLTGPKEQILVPEDTSFSIVIPKLGANAKVFANIDAGSEEEFLPALQQGVAHAKGTVFPGMKGNIYLFAHSTDNFWDVGRYNALFYLLKDLSPGDEVVIFFENRRHTYVITESRTVDADDVSYLVKSQENKEETLLLQTCWPPGTTWKRLMVFAKPKK